MTAIGLRRRWQPPVVATVVLGLILAGIGADTAAGGSAGASAVKKVEIENFFFSPAKLTIAKGSSVAFTNTSGTRHTATRGGAFDTGVIKPGKTVSVRFRQKGSFPYHCEIHPQMRGRIVVD